MEEFFSPSLSALARPEELPGVVEAAEVILANDGRVVVFGDYDCDGVCATAIVSRTLRALGGDVTEFIPDRLTEGYGMSEASIARMLKSNPGVGLVVTVDNGINSVKQIAELNARLAETTAALTETTKSLQAAQALHAGTIQQQLLEESEGGDDEQTDSERKSGFWGRLFHGRR